MDSSKILALLKVHPDLSTTKFIHFHGPTFDDNTIYELDDFKSILANEKFDRTQKTVLYIHGFHETAKVESVHVIVEAYLEHKDINILVLDWGDLADGNYVVDALVNARHLGTVLAKHLLVQFDNGLDINKFHIVGHSLGGQMASMIGRELYIRSKKNKKIKRISALDPGFILFYTGGFTRHLTRHDAEFVDVIHTDAGIYGAPISTGTADFWPNSGFGVQPGCPKRDYFKFNSSDLSSHHRSWWYWAESVANKNPAKFNAARAHSWSDFKEGKFINNDCLNVTMGHDCPVHVFGDYFLQTNAATPFAKGVSGIKYVRPEKGPMPQPQRLKSKQASFKYIAADYIM